MWGPDSSSSPPWSRCRCEHRPRTPPRRARLREDIRTRTLNLLGFFSAILSFSNKIHIFFWLISHFRGCLETSLICYDSDSNKLFLSEFAYKQSRWSTKQKKKLGSRSKHKTHHEWINNSWFVSTCSYAPNVETGSCTDVFIDTKLSVHLFKPWWSDCNLNYMFIIVTMATKTSLKLSRPLLQCCPEMLDAALKPVESSLPLFCFLQLSVFHCVKQPPTVTPLVVVLLT